MEKEDIKSLKAKLFTLLEKEALSKGKFVLSSGKESNYYLDGRVITLTPEGAYLVAAIILEMIKDKGADAVGGPTLGADPVCGALAALSHMKNTPVKSFIVRKAAKEHGKQRLIEGPQLKAGNKVVLIDDVATTGKSLIEAKQALDDMGIKADTAIVIVDRCEGAADNLAKAGLKLESIFKIKDFGL
ncbi:MAG: orotate phosphoribosyltransferase [Candidatus Omnitrophica bacterium]|nr:orotate phosphoribosyltransferase [Candidatus Omnitrophota bacterium]